MPHEEAAGGPQDWFRRACSDLSLARVCRAPDVLLEDLCFHAQQAAEKALKALLVSKSRGIPHTHSIRLLLDSLPPDLLVPPGVEEAAILTDYAVAARYPGEQEPVEEDEYRRAVLLAEKVVTWVKGHL